MAAAGPRDATPCGTSRASREACAAKRLSSDPARAKTGQGNARAAHNGSCVPGPHRRRLEARPAALLRSRSERCAAPPNVEPLEQRATQPCVNEAFDVAGSLEGISRASSDWRRRSRSARVLNAGGHADEDDVAQWQIGARPACRATRHRASSREGHRAHHRLTARRRQPPGGLCRKVGPYRSRIAVTGQVHRHQGARLCQEVPERAPEASVCVKPCRSTSGGPEPRTSTWSGTTGERTGHFSATLVDEWVRLGVTDAVVCAGSRSTPLALPSPIVSASMCVSTSAAERSSPRAGHGDREGRPSSA